MSERDALMRAICANPDEDTPRLVFADWLQENGDETRAAFIRAQCEAARLPAGRARSKVVRRVSELQERFGSRWLNELPAPEQTGWIGWGGWLDGEPFDRGFAACLFAQNTGTLAKHAKVLFSASPVRRLLIWNIKKADKFNQIPHLRHLHTLRVRVVAQQAALDILECRHLDSVPDVRLSLTALPEALIDRLRECFGDRLRHQP